MYTIDNIICEFWYFFARISSYAHRSHKNRGRQSGNSRQGLDAIRAVSRLAALKKKSRREWMRRFPWFSFWGVILYHGTRYTPFFDVLVFSLIRIYLDFAKNRHTWSLWCQKQVDSKTKYKSHARSPAIGHRTCFGLKRPGTPGYVYFV